MKLFRTPHRHVRPTGYSCRLYVRKSVCLYVRIRDNPISCSTPFYSELVLKVTTSALRCRPLSLSLPPSLTLTSSASDTTRGVCHGAPLSLIHSVTMEEAWLPMWACPSPGDPAAESARVPIQIHQRDADWSVRLGESQDPGQKRRGFEVLERNHFNISVVAAAISPPLESAGRDQG